MDVVRKIQMAPSSTDRTTQYRSPAPDAADQDRRSVCTDRRPRLTPRRSLSRHGRSIPGDAHRRSLTVSRRGRGARRVLFDRGRSLLLPLDDRRAVQPADRASMLPAGRRASSFGRSRSGGRSTRSERPLVAHVTPVDLDGDGVMDVVACDVLRTGSCGSARRRAGRSRKPPSATDGSRAGARRSRRPRSGRRSRSSSSRASACCFRATRRSGRWSCSRTTAAGDSPTACSSIEIARVSDVRAGDLDGDGDLDLAVAGFGYNDGADALDGEPGRLAIREHDPAEPVGTDQRGDRRSRWRRRSRHRLAREPGVGGDLRLTSTTGAAGSSRG